MMNKLDFNCLSEVTPLIYKENIKGFNYFDNLHPTPKIFVSWFCPSPFFSFYSLKGLHIGDR